MWDLHPCKRPIPFCGPKRNFLNHIHKILDDSLWVRTIFIYLFTTIMKCCNWSNIIFIWVYYWYYFDLGCVKVPVNRTFFYFSFISCGASFIEREGKKKQKTLGVILCLFLLFIQFFLLSGTCISPTLTSTVRYLLTLPFNFASITIYHIKNCKKFSLPLCVKKHEATKVEKE